MLKSWWNALLDLVYPPKCPACRTGVATHLSWCERCLQLYLQPCRIDVSSHRLTALDGCWAVARYAGAVKKLMHEVKFQQAADKSRYLTWLLSRSRVAAELSGDLLVIPVPLHPARLAERGYNQVELLYQEWAAGQGLVWLGDSLVRTRVTAPQWTLALPERRKNIKGAFAVTRPEVLARKQVLLVDDIFTSGTTLEECAVMLKRAGADSVQGLVLASGAR